MKNPFRSEAEAFRFVLGTAVYFAAIAIAAAAGGFWWIFISRMSSSANRLSSAFRNARNRL